MSGLYDPDGIEFVLSVGIFVVGGLLCLLSMLAWRRERDPKMLTVSVAYLLFALRGLVSVAGYFFHPLLDPETIHPSSPTVLVLILVEHLSALLVLIGLVLFFVALVRR